MREKRKSNGDVAFAVWAGIMLVVSALLSVALGVVPLAEPKR